MKQWLKHAVLCRDRKPRKNCISITDERGDGFVHHSAVHGIFHVTDRTMTCICGKVLMETMQGLRSPHQPSGLSLGLLERVCLSSEIPVVDIRMFASKVLNPSESRSSFSSNSFSETLPNQAWGLSGASAAATIASRTRILQFRYCSGWGNLGNTIFSASFTLGLFLVDSLIILVAFLLILLLVLDNLLQKFHAGFVVDGGRGSDESSRLLFFFLCFLLFFSLSSSASASSPPSPSGSGTVGFSGSVAM